MDRGRSPRHRNRPQLPRPPEFPRRGRRDLENNRNFRHAVRAASVPLPPHLRDHVRRRRSSPGFDWHPVWLAFWWNVYSGPAHPLGRAANVRHDSVRPSGGWRHLFRSRNTWALLLAKFLSDAAWYFFLFWLPRYLSESRHLDIKAIGYFAWIPYAFGAAGSLGGGWCSAFLIGKSLSLGSSRRIVLGISAALLAASLFIAAAPLGLAICFFTMALAG